MAKQKYYVVWQGITPGIYDRWSDCLQQVEGFDGAKYKSFATLAEAEQAFEDGWHKHWGQRPQKSADASVASGASGDGTHARNPEIDYDSISVDVGTWGNPGPIEYRGVDTATGEEIFHVGPIPMGTNNLGEFIAIVHALAYLKQQGSNKTVYTDSHTALKWLRARRVESTLVRDESTARIWELTDRALHWLRTNSYSNKVLKWHTERWGEIKADFGRK